MRLVAVRLTSRDHVEDTSHGSSGQEGNTSSHERSCASSDPRLEPFSGGAACQGEAVTRRCGQESTWRPRCCRHRKHPSSLCLLCRFSTLTLLSTLLAALTQAAAVADAAVAPTAEDVATPLVAPEEELEVATLEAKKSSAVETCIKRIRASTKKLVRSHGEVASTHD